MIHKSRYARWRDDLGRREEWSETVERYTNYWYERGMIPKQTATELYEAIHNMDIMPSMRCLMTAGEALDRDNVAGFNCSYVAVDNQRVFDEIMYILMCGTGVGFSVERQYVNKLPEVSEEMFTTDTKIVVADSKIGWASGFRELISLLYSGKIPSWDLGKLRPAGSKLKTFGGRSSGPEPLDNLFHFTKQLFIKAAGRRLTSLECHDLVCKIAEIVVVGGVRRSALISLSNLSDTRMKTAKSGMWWEDNAQRALANNSVAYTEKPDFQAFMEEMKALHESKCGERGIFSRVAAKKVAAKNGRRNIEHDFGTNPCSEIILRSAQFCNLSEVVLREKDTFEDILDKVTLATIVGSLQSTLTDFRYLRKIWAQNTAEESLLGVSFTGIMDHPVMSGRESVFKTKDGRLLALSAALEEFKKRAVMINEEWAHRLKVNQSTAITCVKPSGTVSQLVNSASGIHPRFSKYYIRTVRMDRKDPLASYMIESGFPYEVSETSESTLVFGFPIKSPDSSVCVKDVGAMSQLKLWETYQDNWCEHKPSVTIYYTDNEFFDICSWVWKNFDKCSGVSFLPVSDHIYKQAPYQDISKDQYEEALTKMPQNFSWEGLINFEKDDTTTASQELACVGTSCEIP